MKIDLDAEDIEWILEAIELQYADCIGVDKEVDKLLKKLREALEDDN